MQAFAASWFKIPHLRLGGFILHKLLFQTHFKIAIKIFGCKINMLKITKVEVNHMWWVVFLSPWYFCQLTDGLWDLHWAQWWPQLPGTESSGLVQKEMKNKLSSCTAFCFKGFLEVHKTTGVLQAKRGSFGANNFTSTTAGLSCHSEFSAFGGHCGNVQILWSNNHSAGYTYKYIGTFKT